MKVSFGALMTLGAGVVALPWSSSANATANSNDAVTYGHFECSASPNNSTLVARGSIPICVKDSRLVLNRYWMYIPGGHKYNSKGRHCGSGFLDNLKKHMITGWKCKEIDNGRSTYIAFNTWILTSKHEVQSAILKATNGEVCVWCHRGKKQLAEHLWMTT